MSSWAPDDARRVVSSWAPAELTETVRRLAESSHWSGLQLAEAAYILWAEGIPSPHLHLRGLVESSMPDGWDIAVAAQQLTRVIVVYAAFGLPTDPEPVAEPEPVPGDGGILDRIYDVLRDQSVSADAVRYRPQPDDATGLHSYPLGDPAWSVSHLDEFVRLRSLPNRENELTVDAVASLFDVDPSLLGSPHLAARAGLGAEPAEVGQFSFSLRYDPAPESLVTPEQAHEAILRRFAENCTGVARRFQEAVGEIAESSGWQGARAAAGAHGAFTASAEPVIHFSAHQPAPNALLNDRIDPDVLRQIIEEASRLPAFEPPAVGLPGISFAPAGTDPRADEGWTDVDGIASVTVGGSRQGRTATMHNFAEAAAEHGEHLHWASTATGENRCVTGQCNR